MLYKRKFLSNALQQKSFQRNSNSCSFCIVVFLHIVYAHGMLTYDKLHWYTFISRSINWLVKTIDDLSITLTYWYTVHVRIPVPQTNIPGHMLEFNAVTPVFIVLFCFAPDYRNYTSDHLWVSYTYIHVQELLTCSMDAKHCEYKLKQYSHVNQSHV